MARELKVPLSLLKELDHLYAEREKKLVEAVTTTIGLHLEKVADMYLKMVESTVPNPEAFSAAPLHITEDEDEARYQYTHGDINLDELKKTLDEYGIPYDV